MGRFPSAKSSKKLLAALLLAAHAASDFDFNLVGDRAFNQIQEFTLSRGRDGPTPSRYGED